MFALLNESIAVTDFVGHHQYTYMYL